MRGLRAKSRDWLFARAEEYRPFGDEYWTFVLNCQRAWASHLVIIAALSVLSEELQINLEMVALSTTGSDHLEPICTATDLPETIRLVYGFDPEHFWACELGDADGKASPILAGPFDKQQYWPPNEGKAGWEARHRGITRRRYDVDDCALLVRCYYNRTADDPEGLTFVRWAARQGETLVINSCELRAVPGQQACDFQLTPPQAPKQMRQQLERAKKKARGPEALDPKQRLRLDRDLDRETRKVCEAT